MDDFFKDSERGFGEVDGSVVGGVICWWCFVDQYELRLFPFGWVLVCCDDLVEGGGEVLDDVFWCFFV